MEPSLSSTSYEISCTFFLLDCRQKLLEFQNWLMIRIVPSFKLKIKYSYLKFLYFLSNLRTKMHLGASHHQVRKVVDLALSLTIDWKEKSYFGLQNIFEINDCKLTWKATYRVKNLGIELLTDSHCLQQIFHQIFLFSIWKGKMSLKVK